MPDMRFRILYLKPSDPTRTAIEEYARHFHAALQGIPGAEVMQALPPSLSEHIAARADREAVRRFVLNLARSPSVALTPPNTPPLIVCVEQGNALHREFWAGYYLQRLLPGARFFCTVHDPPALCSNPYRFMRTEFEGRTPIRLLNVALTKTAETATAWMKRRVETAFLRRCEGVFVLSEGGRDALRRSPLFRNTRVHLLPHVFDLNAADEAASDETGEASAAPGKTGGPIPELQTVLFCFLNAGKGIETLLNAFEMLLERLERERQPVRQRLLIFGGVAPGDRPARYVSRLRERIAASPRADDIAFDPGFVKDAERDRRLRTADILVLPFPSVPIAFSSASVIRALALGKAVVAARANTAPELVRDGETGLLYPENDAGALSERLYRLTLDAALRQRLGANARRRIEHHHTPARVGAILGEVFRKRRNPETTPPPE